MRNFHRIRSPVDPSREHAERTTLAASVLSFGLQKDEQEMTVMASVHPNQQRPVTFTLDLVRKEIDIKFWLEMRSPSLRTGRTAILYRFRIPLAQMTKIIEVVDGNCRALVIPLDTPPSFYRQTDDIEATHDQSVARWIEWFTWFRQTDITENAEALSVAPVALPKDHVSIEIGRWLTYRFVFNNTDTDEGQYSAICSALRDHNVTVVTDNNLKLGSHPGPSVWEWMDHPTQRGVPGLSSLSDMQAMSHNVQPLPYAVRYQLEVCISQGVLREHGISREMIQRLAAMKPRTAQKLLEKVADTEQRYFDPTTIFDLVHALPDGNDKIPRYCTYVRSATVTSSTIYFASPSMETSNRVIRKFQEQEDQFLRVRFSDEKFEGRIRSQDNDQDREVFERIKRTMRNGITIGDRHFEFLAFGNSQFRENGAYFFASTPSISAATIRQWMGDFTAIRSVAKYASRVGQCFSTTRAINSTKVSVVRIGDVNRTVYCFTDGVGKLSVFLAQMIAAEIGLLNPYLDYPSLFQFRLAGCKGVLAVDPRLPPTEIHIRPSQEKFPAAYQGLEIIRVSSFATAYLNQQIILVLSTLGVSDDVFITKLRNMLSDLENAVTNETIALRVLQRNIDLNQTTLIIASMILDGFMKRAEPFMMSLLSLWRAWNVKYLKEKAKILIERGAFLLGCVDETATLKGHFDNDRAHEKSGSNGLSNLPQIFVQIPDDEPERKGRYKILEGPCLLARNPSLHPGDIRVVQAVNVPQLAHMKNVVVLPQTGDRDVANMCSGGDLDGDDYLVMWDPSLMPKVINHPPMDYTAPPPLLTDGPVALNDITDFFVDFMKNDRLPTIAVAHRAWADNLEEGVSASKCIKLAELHSQAVDYSKTGVPARMTRDLRPSLWPHWMEKKYLSDNQIYHSKKILGRIYDAVTLVEFKPEYDLEFDTRILKAYELSEDILADAAEVKTQYDAAVRRIMAQYGIKTEFEVWSTFVMGHNREKSDYNFAEEMGRITGALKDTYRDLCCRKAGSTSGVSDFAKTGPFVAAMYTVTANEVANAREECNQMKLVGGRQMPVRKKDVQSMPFMSFPYIFVNELGRIASGKIPTVWVATQPKTRKRHANKTVLVDLLSDVEIDNSGDLETAEGIVHRGDLLDLFHLSEPIAKDQLPDVAKTDDHIAMVDRGISGPQEIPDGAKLHVQQGLTNGHRDELGLQGRELDLLITQEIPDGAKSHVQQALTNGYRDESALQGREFDLLITDAGPEFVDSNHAAPLKEGANTNKENSGRNALDELHEWCSSPTPDFIAAKDVDKTSSSWELNESMIQTGHSREGVAPDASDLPESPSKAEARTVATGGSMATEDSSSHHMSFEDAPLTHEQAPTSGPETTAERADSHHPAEKTAEVTEEDRGGDDEDEEVEIGVLEGDSALEALAKLVA
ncbi:hypothetical protein LTR66_006931 [Elasticomyces elasticus]|nr:hypothetical protein LTR66_006931 [Elasticomyces elasticus]